MINDSSAHWVDRYLRPLGACTDAMGAAYMYNSPREAWENWDDIGDMLWLLGKAGYASANPVRMIRCFCDLAEHVLPVYEKYYPNDDRSGKALGIIRAAVELDGHDPDRANKFFAIDLATADLRKIAKENPYTNIARVAMAVDALAEYVRSENFTCVSSVIQESLVTIVEDHCEYEQDIDAADNERQWQCDCVRRYFPSDLFDFEEKDDD
jgi:hypothetical protein